MDIAPFDVLNEYCIWEILRIMDIVSILVFGCTNVRHRAFVHNFIAARQETRGNIRFVLNESIDVMREIMLRFGEHFIMLEIFFGAELINMDIFQDENEGCMINNVDELNLRAYLNEGAILDIDDDDDCRYDRQDYDYYNIENSIPPMLNRFRLNAENIITSINNDEIPTLRRLVFNFNLGLTPRSYNRMDGWFPDIDPILNALFIGLRRGNMTFNYTTCYIAHSMTLTLEIDL